MAYVISYDIGTTGVKTCLYNINKTIELIGSAQEGYELYVFPDGGAEQDEEEWWCAMQNTTRRIMEESGINADKIEGISFCSQMQGLVLVDKEGNALRHPMSYMDQRAKKELKEGIGNGITIAGANIFKLITALRMTGAVGSSVKDPVWKYNWVRNNEPEVFKKVYKWLDVKEYLILRCTGEFVMTPDSAFSTFVYDTRKGKEGFSKKLCKLYGIEYEHMPRIIGCEEVAGHLTSKAAGELSLREGIPVYGGGGDATLIGVGAGCANVGDTHIYQGTSGWVSTIVDHQTVDTNAMIAAIVGAQKDKYNYFAEMETAGKCFSWVREHLALDEIGVYLNHQDVTSNDEAVCRSLYDYMSEVVKNVPPGSGGVIFTPWLHGNRCPFESSEAAGMFFNLHIETGKTEMIRAVLEGICYHLNWMLECESKKIQTSDTIRFCGGGALSDVTSQILSDITGRKIEVVENPQNVGSLGAAALVGVGLGIIDGLERVPEFVPVEKEFLPNINAHEQYDKYYKAFKTLFKNNKKTFEMLN